MKESSYRKRSLSDPSTRKCFVGGLNYLTDNEKLKNYFEVFGYVQEASVMREPGTLKSRGFGFVTFADHGILEIVLSQDHIIDGRKVEIKRSVPKVETNNALSPTVNVSVPMSKFPMKTINVLSPNARIPMTIGYEDPLANNKIFVGGLHFDVKDDEFREYFEKFGKVITSEVMFHKDSNKSRGFGFVIYEDSAAVDAVCYIQKVRGHAMLGKPIEVKRAIPKGKMLADQHADHVPAEEIRNPGYRDLSSELEQRYPMSACDNHNEIVNIPSSPSAWSAGGAEIHGRSWSESEVSLSSARSLATVDPNEHWNGYSYRSVSNPTTPQMASLNAARSDFTNSSLYERRRDNLESSLSTLLMSSASPPQKMIPFTPFCSPLNSAPPPSDGYGHEFKRAFDFILPPASTIPRSYHAPTPSSEYAMAQRESGFSMPCTNFSGFVDEAEVMRYPRYVGVPVNHDSHINAELRDSNAPCSLFGFGNPQGSGSFRGSTFRA